VWRSHRDALGKRHRSNSKTESWRSQAGDSEAFGALVTKYRTKILITVYGMVRNEHDAWDLSQDVFLKAWRSIHQFKEQSSFYTWLYRISMNATIESLRRTRHEEVELTDAIPSSSSGPHANYRCTEIRERVNAALSKLSPEHQAVIVLKEIEGMQYYEIAAILGLSIGTVMSRLFYARKHLKSLLRFFYNVV
jgi:RNA polymerase sigma-70 factor, ECF subfamily